MDLGITHKIYEEYAEVLAMKIFKHLDKSSSVTLDDIRTKISIIEDKKTIDIYNWHEATCVEELLDLKNKELKHILSNNSRSKTGNKKILAVRVWNITHPETVAYKSKKHQVISKGENNLHYIEDSSDSDSSDSQYDYASNIEDIIRHASGINIKQEEFRYLPKKKWIFKEYSHYYKFIGILKDGAVHPCAIPNELKQYYLQEQY